jgi:tetratricopeptide (TPR) repeat protein
MSAEANASSFQRVPSTPSSLGFWKMSISFSVKTFVTAMALLLICVTSKSQPVDDLIRNGDELELRLHSSEALNLYLAAEKLDPTNPSVLLRIARQYRHLMTDAGAREEKLRLGSIGLNYAKRAAILAPTDSEAQLSPAISYGKMVSLQGPKEQTEAARRIKEGADKAIQLDPRNDLAWHVLGRWNRVLANTNIIKKAFASLVYGELPAGSSQEAVLCFQKAIEINPRRPMHFIELGLTYAQMGNDSEARKMIATGLAMPNVEKDDPEIKEQGRNTLAHLH